MLFDINILKLRYDFLKSLRDYLDSLGFLEIETPYLITSNTPDPYIDPIQAIIDQQKTPSVQLRTSPEIWLKRALGLGLDKIYELARVFRDDPLGPAHNKEFTMLEWYRTNADLNNLIADCEHIFLLAQKAGQAHMGLAVEPVKPFKICSVDALFERFAGLDLNYILEKIEDGNVSYLQEKLSSNGEHLPKDSTFMDAFFHIMLKYIEPNLEKDRPVVVIKWPVQLAALAAPSAEDPRYCDRFEIYYQGLEIANAYQECNDKDVLLKRFNAENRLRTKLNKPVFVIDYAFLDSLSALPKTAGIALGIDRLLQSVMQITHLRDLIFGYPDSNFSKKGSLD